MDPQLEAILALVETRLDDVVATSVERYFEQVPAYATSSDPELRANAARHSRAVFDAVLTTLRAGRPATAEDLGLTADQAVRRLRAGLELADFLAGFRIGQVTLWEAVAAAAQEVPGDPQVALAVATHLMQVIEVGSVLAGDAFAAARRAALAESDRVRRDLVEDLLAGREPAGSRAAVVEELGLAGAVPLLVVLGVPTASAREDVGLRSALWTLRGSTDAPVRSLVVVRHDTVVGVVPRGPDEAGTIRWLERAQQQLVRLGVPLGIGVSTVHTGLSGVPQAFGEAGVARDSLDGEPGVRALSTLSTLDYLVLRPDDTVRRLVRPQVRATVAEDRERDGVLVPTLEAYLAADLNAKTAAERLGVHVNTAYYRLERIAERTGCDLRRFDDLVELAVAVRVLDEA